MKKLAIVLAFFGSSMGMAQAPVAPFGIPKGTSISRLLQLGATPGENPGNYALKNAPVPNSSFESYLVRATPEHGVCKIVGVGFTIKNDSDGTKTRAAFNDLAYALTQKYGNGKKFDFLHANSIWDEARDWMMAVRQDERTLAFYWDLEEGSRMPQGLESISLVARALNSQDGYLVLTYEFDNFSKCNAALKGDPGKGL